MVQDCNADTQANALYTSLIAGSPTPPTVDLSDSKFSFTVDNTSDLYAAITGISLQELTEGCLDGDGVYDKLMASVDLHIQREFKGNRLTGDQYAKVYTEVMVAVLAQSTQFLLSKDQARWAAIAAQMEARIVEIKATEALILLEKTKMETQKAIFDMQNSGAEYALTKMKIANEDADYCLTQVQTSVQSYTLDNILPVSFASEQHKLNYQLPAQTNLLNEQVEAERSKTMDTRTDLLTPIAGLLGKSKESVVLDIAAKQYQLDNVLPIQLNLVEEQREAERAKTMDTRSDAVTTVTGSIGKQKELYDEQISSFEKDAKYKTAKMYLDAWITQKTLDEGLTAPVQLQNAAIDEVMLSIRTTNDLT